MTTNYMFLSFPKAFMDSHNQDVSSLISAATSEPTTVSSFSTPNFKVGTLDGLMQNADELSKMADSCQLAAVKVSECSKVSMEGTGETSERFQLRNRTIAEQYVETFAWDATRYRSDRTIHELIDLLRKELLAVDEIVRARLAQHQSARVNLGVVEKLRHGNLTTKSLTTLVDPAILVPESEFIETHLVVIPATSTREFLKDYETLVPMVVPRSALQVTHDENHSLYAVSTFKKQSGDFLNACKVRKWIPRHFKPLIDAQAKEQKDFDDITQIERKARAEVLRLGKSEWSEVVKIWMHTLSLQVFVEAVLRYGFPLDHTSFCVKTTLKAAKKIKSSLDAALKTYENKEFGRSKLSWKDSSTPQNQDLVGFTDNSPSYVYYELRFP